MNTALLAHQGGWDELLMVAVPVVLFAFLVRLANRRAGALGDAAPDPDPDVESETAATDRRPGLH